MDNLLEVSGLCKDFAFANEKLPKRLLKDAPENPFRLEDVSFVVPKGYIMGFIGPNGAGKTTTIKLILQIKRKDAGVVRLFGREEMRNDEIGVVMDIPHFPDSWRLHQVENALAPFYYEWNSETYSKSLKKFELDPKKRVRELSRGMQVKLQIAIALSHNARMLIMDEPTSGLDPVARDEVCELLQEFVQDGKRSVIFSTHITSDLERIADYVTMILRGRIAYTGTKDDLLATYSRVVGGADDLNDEQKKLAIGYRKHSAGFEGLIKTTDKQHMPAGVLVEPPNLEEIIIFLNRGSRDKIREDLA